MLQLLGQQMTHRNFCLFLLRIAGQLDNLHAVEQRTRNGIQCVRRCDKQHIGQVKRQLNIMIAESVVLLCIQHFEQSSSWITAGVCAHLINFVHQNQGIFAACLCQRRHNTTRHCTDISLSVSANIRFIAHTAERHACVLAVHRLCDRANNGRLADTRRADQTQYLSLELRRKRFNRQKFHNAIFYFIQSEMVAVKHLACLL